VGEPVSLVNPYTNVVGVQTVFWAYLFIGFYALVVFFSVLVIPMCGRQSWPALWSTFGRTII